MTLVNMTCSSHFDDVFRRATNIITSGGEAELICFLESFENCRLRWLDSENEIESLKKRNKQLEDELKASNTKLKHMRCLVEKEVYKRQEAEKIKQNYEQLVNCIRDVLLNNPENLDEQTKERLASFGSPLCIKSTANPGRLSIIEESAMSTTDVSFDRTDDTLDSSLTDVFNSSTSHQRRRRKRKSRQPVPAPARKKSSLGSGDILENLTLPLANSTSLQVHAEPVDTTSEESCKRSADTNDNFRERLHLATRQRETFSQVHNEELGTTGPFQTYPSQSTLAPEVPKLQKTPVSNSQMRHFSSTGKLNNRPHVFVSKTVYVGLETCHACGRRVRFYKTALCCVDCKATCHQECKDKIPLPCVPTVNTPSNRKGQHTIADYTPSLPPMVPPIIIYCCSEIESRGMNDVGLYRLSGPVTQVKELKEKILKGKGTPNLSKIDIHVLCNVVKKFLSELQEPLITRSLWRSFVQATETTNTQDENSGLFQAISELPPPNRDTLAYLILHLQKVVETPECLMNIDSMAKIFGPTLVGYSVPDPPAELAYQETPKQAAVVQCLLQISSDYWNSFIKIEDNSIFPPIQSSPFTAQISAKVPTGDNTQASRVRHQQPQRPLFLGRTPQTPKLTKPPVRSVKSVKRQPFFASPMIK